MHVMKCAVRSNYLCHVCVTNLVRSFPETPRLVVVLNDEAVSKNCNVTRNALLVTYLDNAVLSSADDCDLRLYIDAPENHTHEIGNITRLLLAVFCTMPSRHFKSTETCTATREKSAH